MSCSFSVPPILCLSCFSSFSVSAIPQSDLVHWAKSIAALLEPKPWGSAVALYSLTHQKQTHDYAMACGVLSNQYTYFTTNHFKWSLIILWQDKQRCTRTQICSVLCSTNKKEVVPKTFLDCFYRYVEMDTLNFLLNFGTYSVLVNCMKMTVYCG